MRNRTARIGVARRRESINRDYAERLVVATFSERSDLLGRVFEPDDILTRTI
jgi:hypothetical protein